MKDAKRADGFDISLLGFLMRRDLFFSCHFANNSSTTEHRALESASLTCLPKTC